VVNYYCCISKNFDEECYLHVVNINSINKAKKILIVEDEFDNTYRNSINYFQKISEGIKIIDDTFDLFIICRSDLIINNIDFIDFIDFIDNNKLFLSNTQNKFINEKHVCEYIMITKNYDLLKHLINIYQYAQNNNDYSEIILYNYLILNNIPFEILDINYKLILSKINVIAISGDSGSGKSTISNLINEIYNSKNILKFETDRYHKWERGDERYKKYSHLNPDANNLEKMYNDIYQLKIGNEIYEIDYDHHIGKFTPKEKIESKNTVIFCGLHTLYNDKINGIIDIKIYMDTDIDLIKKWKIKRDVEQRGYNIEKVLNQIDVRQKDYLEYIKIQKENADIIINFYETTELKCNIIIQTKHLFDKILLYFPHHDINLINDILTIRLKNCIDNNLKNILKKYNIEINNNYYDEIKALFILLIFY
jgi:uridine kinase